MNLLKFSNMLKVALASAALATAGVNAAPIFTADVASPSSESASAMTVGASDSAMVRHMGFTSGYRHTVAFRGDDNTVMIGHYATGPWSKKEFLLAWRDIRGGGGEGGGNDTPLPVVETVAGLPEPSTFALLALALFGIGVLQRRRAAR